MAVATKPSGHATARNGRDGPADWFRLFARSASDRLGSPWAFSGAVAVVLLWGLSGPVFGFSSTWQLVINTGTTIVTFLMVFLLQNTQNRDSVAIHLKLDELLRGTQGTRTGLVNLEVLSDSELSHLHDEFVRLSEEHGAEIDELRDDIAEELKGRTGGARDG